MRQKDVMLQPTPPAPPEINGYLKKLKRKTRSIGGNWNTRWFFVDSRRREFGYADSQSSALRSSIYLDDITAVVQFDDTHFQVESRTRNFFLWGESKASTSCWVTSLESYRKKVIEYEKDKIAYAAATATGGSQALALTAGNDNSKPVVPISRQTRESVKTTSSLTIQSKQENGNNFPANRLSSKNEQRNASPLARDDLGSSNGNQSRKPMASDREKRNRDHRRDRERSRDRDRESKHERKHKRELSDDRDRSGDRAKASNGDPDRHRDRNARALDSGRAAVMQAWVDDF